MAAAALATATLFLLGAFLGMGSSPSASKGLPQAIVVTGPPSSPSPEVAASPSAASPAPSATPPSSPTSVVAVGRRVQTVPLSQPGLAGTPGTAATPDSLAAGSPAIGDPTPGALPVTVNLPGSTTVPTSAPVTQSVPTPSPLTIPTSTAIAPSPTTTPLLQRILGKLKPSPTK